MLQELMRTQDRAMSNLEVGNSAWPHWSSTYTGNIINSSCSRFCIVGDFSQYIQWVWEDVFIIDKDC